MTINSKLKRIARYILFGALALLFLGIVFWAIAPWTAGLSEPPDWTGFNTYENDKGELVTAGGVLIQAKTLWDWLDLLIGGLIVGGVLAIGAYYLNRSARENELKIAEENRQQAALQDYYDKMADWVLDHSLKLEGRSIARARTLATLRGLDSQRKGSLLRFLHESKLIRNDEAIVDLRGADLKGSDLSGADLSTANLYLSNLSGADLRWAILNGTNLHMADLRGADLLLADLSKADLRVTNLSEATLFAADLSGADLDLASLGGADLREANLEGTSLTGAVFNGETRWPDGFDPKKAGAINL